MHNPLVFLTSVLVLGVLGQWVAWRVRIPSILLLLGSGFLVGTFAGADPDEVIGRELLFPAVSLAVATILLEGGLTLQFHELREAGRAVFRLVTVGVVVTWILTMLSCWLLTDLDWRLATLTGAILTVTGPTVIQPLLRHIQPARRVGAIAKWEGIVVDPVGAVLAVLVYEALYAGNFGSAALALGKTLVVGIGLGVGAAVALVELARRYWIPDFLTSPMFLAVALGTFTCSNQISHESGLVTVTILGIALGNQKRVPVQHVLEFKENLRVLLISCLFIVLAARIKLDQLLELGPLSLVLLASMILIVRPAAVFLATWGTDLRRKDKVFLSFLAPRGIVAAAVSSVFALEVAGRRPDTVGLASPDRIVAVTFLVIVGTVTVYGLLAAPLAKRLGLAIPNPQGILFAGASTWVRAVAEVLHAEDYQVLMVDTNYHNVAQARLSGVPAQCASVLSEYVTDELDLTGIGRVIAATPNDDLNSLATQEFVPQFGRAQVYQLYASDKVAARNKVPSHMRGRQLFQRGVTHSEITFRYASGYQVKKTKITEEFRYEDFLVRYGKDSVLLFVITESEQLLVNTVDEPLKPKSGQTLIALVPPSSEQTELEARSEMSTSESAPPASEATSPTTEV